TAVKGTPFVPSASMRWALPLPMSPKVCPTWRATMWARTSVSVCTGDECVDITKPFSVCKDVTVYVSPLGGWSAPFSSTFAGGGCGVRCHASQTGHVSYYPELGQW